MPRRSRRSHIEIQICRVRVIFCALRFRVEANHASLVQRSFQATQCSNCIRARGLSKQEDRLILRKELKVVLENDEIVLFYLCIRRVGVLYVDRSVGERAVTERVINADDVLLGKSVTLAQRLPAILPIQEFVRESDLEPGMFSQIADRADTEPLSFAAPHHQRISIVEPERLRHAYAERCERLTNLFER